MMTLRIRKAQGSAHGHISRASVTFSCLVWKNVETSPCVRSQSLSQVWDRKFKNAIPADGLPPARL
jgi:hypothetical protein